MYLKKLLRLAKRDITTKIQNLDIQVLSKEDISNILKENKDLWGLKYIELSVKRFIQFLVEEEIVKEFIFESPNRKIKRYSVNDVSIYDVASTLIKNAYFSHYSAIYLHQLTEQIPKKLYLNYEQSKKPRNKSTLNQENINKAFKKPQRKTNNIIKIDNTEIFVLNGMYSNNLGVISVQNNKSKISITNLERTLIDIVVRPSYSGGVFEILKAYKNAKDKISVNKLVSILKKLDYIYPYHQSIGFYLDKAGYSEKQLSLISNFEIKYDFYLETQISDYEYCSKWKLYIPKGFSL